MAVTHRRRVTLGGRTEPLVISTGRAERLVVEFPTVARLEAGLFPGRAGSGLILPGPWTEGLHPVPHVLAAIAETRSREDASLLIVGHPNRDEPEDDVFPRARAQTIRCLLENDVDGWVELATHTGALRDIEGYLAYLHEQRDWRSVEVEPFQREYNQRFGESIFEDGICGEQTLGAVFEVLRSELVAFCERDGVTDDAIASATILYGDGAGLDPGLASLDQLGSGPGIDLVVVDGADVGDSELDVDLLYESARVRFRTYSAFSSNLDTSMVHVQILSQAGESYSVVELRLVAGSEVYEVKTDHDGVAVIPDVVAESFQLELPPELQLPHPRDVVVQPDFEPAPTDIAVPHTPKQAVAVAANRKIRLIVGDPPANYAVAGCHFEPASAFPAESMVYLVDTLCEVLAAQPGHRLVAFGHAVAGTSQAKVVAERRARLTHAALVGDVEELLAVAEVDGWEQEHFIALLGFLGVDPLIVDPTDEERIAEFQRRYAEGEYFDDQRGRGAGAALSNTGVLDGATKRAIMDAYVAELASDVKKEDFGPMPLAGCAEFNPCGETEDRDSRVTLAVFAPDRLPSQFPCELGNPDACEREQGFNGRCRFYRQRVQEQSPGLRVLADDAPLPGEEPMVMGSRMLSGPGHAAVVSAYATEPLVESVRDGMMYAYLPDSGLLLEAGGLDASSGLEGASGDVLPRVHWISHAKLAGLGNASKRLPLGKPPDGNALHPMEWSKSDPRTLAEIFRDFFVRAFSRLSGLPEPAPQSTADLLDKFDPIGTPPDVESALEKLTGASFDDVTRHVLIAGLVAAGQALNPADSARYIHRKGVYKCNIYATDFVGLLPHGAWLPKVGWSFPFKVRRDPGSVGTARINGVSVTGVNRFINGKPYGGKRYGWFKIEGDGRRVVQSKAQDMANEGTLVVFSAGNDLDIGHVGVVVPEKRAFKGKHVIDDWGNAARLSDGNRVSQVWRSQAGAVNGHGMREGTQVLHPSHSYTTPGYFFYDPAKDESRGTDVERESLKPPGG